MSANASLPRQIDLLVPRTITQTKVVLAAAASAAVVATNTGRRYLAIKNIGSGDVTLSFNGSAAVVGDGWTLEAGGGGMIWEGSAIPANAIRAISAPGSTLIVLEG